MVVSKKLKWVHLIGVCGVAMAPVANMFKKMGWFVSGSDKGIFPPMSDYLKERKIAIELGFKKEHVQRSYYVKKYGTREISENPDLVVVGNFAGLSNAEYKEIKKKKLKAKNYPEVFAQYLVKSNSVVVAGTYGKTTSTALLALIFQEAKKNPSFMIGGIAKNFDDGVVNTRGKWSIIEGDEYISARFDPISKFFHYKPEFLLLTACAWEHTDIFKTEQDYIDNFKKLIRSLPQNGIILANKNGENVLEVIKESHCKVLTYELNKLDEHLANAIWFNLPHKENAQTGEIVIFNSTTKETFSVNTELIGDHNRENIIGCCALARELGIDIDPIQRAVSKFKGIKRRLEIRYEEERVKVVDDHACSPPKVEGSLAALRQTFPDWHITVIFEPNVGTRTTDALPLFKKIFDQANEVVIPHLKAVKTEAGERRTTGKQLSDAIEEENVKATYIGTDDVLVKYVTNKDVGKHIICFMGAYSFRGMIDQVVDVFKNRK